MKVLRLLLLGLFVLCLTETGRGFFHKKEAKNNKPILKKAYKKKYKKTFDKELLPNWRQVQEQAQDTVVQLFVQVASFNWKEPFKSPKQRQSYGSAFFIDADGYLVSNFHVVNEGEVVEMQIPSQGKRRFRVNTIGVSPEHDISLLKIADDDLKILKENLGAIPFLTLGDSDKVFRTQQVLALGYPLGQEKLKSTQGIVSGREDVEGDSYIQMTAPINPGSSGGPLLNSDGKVIGVNAAGIADAQNVGYIIPINEVKHVIQALRIQKLLRKPDFGIEINKGNKELVQFLNNPMSGGFYVSRVYKNSLLAQVGVEEGDMIYVINECKFDLYGETYVSWSEDKVHLDALLNRFTTGEKINLEFYRNGQKKVVSFNFNLTNQLPVRRWYPHYEKIEYEIIGGMVVMELTLNHIDLFDDSIPDLVKYRRRENQYVPRLIVTHIFHNSPVRQARVIRAGDILDEVNEQKVYTLQDFRTALKKTEGFLTFKTDIKRFMVLALDDVLRHEERLSTRYFYKKSQLVDELAAYAKKQKAMIVAGE